MLGRETNMGVDVVRSPLHGWTMKHIYTRWQQKPGGTRIATYGGAMERVPAALRTKVRLTPRSLIANPAHRFLE